MASGAQDVASIGNGIATGFMTGGPVGAAVGALASIPTLFQTSLAGIQKEDATTVANALEPMFRLNVQLFQENPTYANQQQAIVNFESMWMQFTTRVTSLAKAGTAAINDRAPGGKVDWWKLYLDPIKNATLKPDGTPISNQALSAPSNYWTQSAIVTPANPSIPSAASPPKVPSGRFVLVLGIAAVAFGVYSMS